MDEATDIERRADKVVQTITAKGPELVLAIHRRLAGEAEKTVLPWVLTPFTSVEAFDIQRKRATNDETAASIIMHGHRWEWRVAGYSSGVCGTVGEAYKAADDTLQLHGHLLMPGRPTAAPWHQTSDTLWVRRILGGAPNSEIARVRKRKIQGSNWYQMLPKLSGPGPTEEQGPWGTAKLAMAGADILLRRFGWTTTGP